MVRTTVLRLCGQSAIGPTGVLDQSKARVRSPISPPPASKASGSEIESCWRGLFIAGRPPIRRCCSKHRSHLLAAGCGQPGKVILPRRDGRGDSLVWAFFRDRQDFPFSILLPDPEIGYFPFPSRLPIPLFLVEGIFPRRTGGTSHGCGNLERVFSRASAASLDAGAGRFLVADVRAVPDARAHSQGTGGRK